VWEYQLLAVVLPATPCKIYMVKETHVVITEVLRTAQNPVAVMYCLCAEMNHTYFQMFLSVFKISKLKLDAKEYV